VNSPTAASLSADHAPDSPIGRVALRKASLRLLPLIAIGFGIAYMDRVNVSFAALQMNHDLGFSASVYGLGAGLFFLSYAASETPSNLLHVRFGARRWLARIMITWGILSIAMMFVRTPAQFYLARLAVGAAEAGFFPGVIFYLSQWFPAARRSQAISGFFIAFPLSSVIMGALAGALLNLNGRLGLAGWQWLFLVEGLPAVLMSVVFLRLLPDGPADAKWLTAAERTWILTQLRNEDAHLRAHSNNLRHALREPRVWLMGAALFCIYIGSYSYIFSAPIIIKSITTLSITHVGFAISLISILGAVAMLFNGWHSERTRERFAHVLIPTLCMAAGFIAAGLTANPFLVLPAFAVIFMSFCALMSPVWTIPPTFLTGTAAAAGIAIINTLGSCGGFVGPWFMGRADDLTGSFQRGLLITAIPILIGAAILLLVRRYSIRIS
jgi:MFS transporter, ACS family, tartrate transporter